jgi:photosystem II stability/assembly factor-like uncharacterized protein
MKKYLCPKYKAFLLCFLVSITLTFGRTYHGAALAPDGQNGWVVASDTAGYILHTPNCGINWTIQSVPDERRLVDVFFLTEQKGWIGGDQGFIFYTENGGANWSRQALGLAKEYVTRISFIDDSCGWAACSERIVARTIHGGLNYSWEQICLPNPPFNSETVNLSGISFVDRQKGWFCVGRYPFYVETLPGQGDTWFTKGQGYIAKSSDGGVNWQLLRRDTIYDFFDIKFQDSLNGFVVGGNDRTMSAVMIRTSNGGNTWQIVSIPAQTKFLRAMDVINNNYIWAVGHNGTIIHSRNGGQAWIQQQSNVNTALYDVDFADTLHGLVAGDSYVLYTHDGGNTWHIANLGVEEERSMLNATRNTLEIYPNPAKTFFTVRAPLNARGSMLRMFDVTGKVVKELESSGNRQLRISLDRIKNGVYFVQVGDELVKEKLVVTR